MAISIQTNANSLIAQENLRVNNDFQAQTIQRLTSGFRINQSGDDAAGLAIANKFRSDITELTQGVRNANDAISQLQIVDGGLSNISKILDRMKTLATQSGSTTFTGSRTTLNNEFQSLAGEIDRQAKNVKLDSAGTYKTVVKAYIGGADGANSNAMVTVDLSATGVDTAGLKLSGSTIMGGGTGFTGNTTRLDDSMAKFNTGVADGTVHEDFAISYVDSNGAAQRQTVSVNAKVAGWSGSDLVQALNTAITGAKIDGISAQIGGDGTLQFIGSKAFVVTHSATGAPAAQSVLGAATQTLTNGGQNVASGDFTAFADGAAATTHQTERLKVTTGGQDYTIDLTSDNTSANYAGNLAGALTAINRQLAGSGVSAVQESTGKISFQSGNAFTMTLVSHVAGNGGAGRQGDLFGTTAGNVAVTTADSDSTVTGNALKAIDAVTAAVANLGQVQGKIGTGQNQLKYAINLAQSQISNFSAAESRIRDTDVAAEAANLTKASVLSQASMAAMAQANSAPQAVLALLRG